MPSFEFKCLDCKTEWILADLDDTIDVSATLCCDCSGHNVELVGYSKYDDPYVLELARRVQDLEKRVEALGKWVDFDEDEEDEEVKDS